MTSAFGNTALPSLRRRPLMWSPWKWLMMIVSTCAGSKPAALKFAIQVPDVGAPVLPLPVSMSTILPPVLSTVVVNGIGGQEGLLLRLLHLVERGVLHEAVGKRTQPDAVVDGRRFDVADLVAIEPGSLLRAAGGRRRGGRALRES